MTRCGSRWPRRWREAFDLKLAMQRDEIAKTRKELDALEDPPVNEREVEEAGPS